MADIIEESKSNRATCRSCREKIDKGVLRFGAETPNAFGDGPSYQWHHLACAAGKMPAKVKEALKAFAGEVPNRAEIEAILANPPKSGKGGGAKAAANFPYAERASTSRSKCLSCEEAIEKGQLRVAVEREVDTGSFVTKGPGYLHPGCAVEFTGDDNLLEGIKANSASLAEADFSELSSALGGEGGEEAAPE